MDVRIFALICMIPIFLNIMSTANAYVENVQLTDQAGNPVSVRLENPSIVTTIGQGWFWGSVQTSNTQVVQSMGLENFVSEIKSTATGSEVDFAGKLDTTGSIKLIDNSGQSWTLILESKVTEKTSQDPSVTDYAKTLPEWVYAVVPVVIAGIIIVVWKKKTSGSIIL